jgi:BirA family biotin operon repressor/biotin-[acetyl-CoA-carboxylase] ligase
MLQRIIGTKLSHFPELGSTNDYATQLLSKSKPKEGTVVITDHQVKGKGQYGRKWNSAPGQNLTLSVILYPNIHVDTQFDLNIMASLSVCAAIEQQTAISAQVKWPNDIYVRDRKICGILIKNNLSGSLISQSVVGIGINVNQQDFDPILPNPTSLILQSGVRTALSDLREQLFEAMDRYYSMLKNDPVELRQTYSKILWRRSEEIHYKLEDGELRSGVLEGIERDGRLIIRSHIGMSSYKLSEIKIVV